MKKKALVIGGVTYDTMIYMDKFPEPKPQTFFSNGFNQTVGGTGAGKSMALRRLGFQTTLHALIGNDAPGRKVRDYLRKEKVQFNYEVDPKGTEMHTNLMNSEGSRISIYMNYASFGPHVHLNRISGYIDKSDYILLNIINYARLAIPLIKKAGKEIWCDIHDYDGKNEYHREFIDSADYLFMSSDDLPDYKDFMEKMIISGKKAVICTHGAKGASAMTEKDG